LARPPEHRRRQRPVRARPGCSSGRSRDSRLPRRAERTPPMTSSEMSARPLQMSSADVPGDAASGRNGGQARARLVRRGSPGYDLLSGNEWERAVRDLNLSGREQEIARAIFDDRTESSIAEKLGIS